MRARKLYDKFSRLVYAAPDNKQPCRGRKRGGEDIDARDKSCQNGKHLRGGSSRGVFPGAHYDRRVAEGVAEITRRPV